jgi:hypothetical protein
MHPHPRTRAPTRSLRRPLKARPPPACPAAGPARVDAAPPEAALLQLPELRREGAQRVPLHHPPPRAAPALPGRAALRLPLCRRQATLPGRAPCGGSRGAVPASGGDPGGGRLCERAVRGGGGRGGGRRGGGRRWCWAGGRRPRGAERGGAGGWQRQRARGAHPGGAGRGRVWGDCVLHGDGTGGGARPRRRGGASACSMQRAACCHSQPTARRPPEGHPCACLHPPNTKSAHAHWPLALRRP